MTVTFSTCISGSNNHEMNSGIVIHQEKSKHVVKLSIILSTLFTEFQVL